MMTIREVIRELRKFPENDVLHLRTKDGKYFTLDSIEAADPPLVWERVRKKVVEFRDPQGNVVFTVDE